MPLPPVSNLVPFPSSSRSPRPAPEAADFSTARGKILLKTRPGHPVTAAYGIELIDAIRLSEFQPEARFSVELRRDHLRQSLLCGLLDPTYRTGIAVSVDPVTGAVMDLAQDGGVLGYMRRSCLGFSEPVRVELRLQRFGRNVLTSVFIDGDSFFYPSFVSESHEVFQALVGSDVDSGAAVSYRHASLWSGMSAASSKVA
jgi:hypothetical protein